MPVSQYKPLDAPWEEFLARLGENPDLAAITRINVYRREPAANRGWLIEVQEPIDERWIAKNFGGGVYDVKIKQKPDISHYERGIVISGDPKTPNAPTPTAAAQQSAQNNDTLAAAFNRQTELIEKMFERQSQPAPAPASNAASDAQLKLVMEGATAAIKLVGESVSAALKPAAPAPAEDAVKDKLLAMIIDRAFKEPPPPRSLDDELGRLEKLNNILKSNAPAPAASSSLVDQLTVMEKVFGMVDKIRGDGGGELDWKALAVREGLNVIPGVMDKLEKIFTANARATQARAEAARTYAASRGAAPLPGAPAPAGGAPPPPPGARPHVVSTAPTWGGPLDFETAGEATPPAAEPPTPEVIQNEMAIADRFVKAQLVRLVAENAEPEMVLTVIDGMAPAMGALLSRVPEAQIREFLANDPILSEITRLPHYEQFLKRLLELAQETEPEDPS